MNNNIQNFIDNCVKIVDAKGVIDFYRDGLHKILCQIPYEDQTISYEDNKIAIVKSITSKALVILKLDNNNPEHGEYIYLVDYVNNIIQGLK